MQNKQLYKIPKKPWLSVIIPIYNAEQYIGACLNSIATQTFKNYEVIMVDDGSTDNSSDICRKMSQSDYRFKYHRIENCGALGARLYGMDKVRGEYFTFCDADDYYCHSKAFEILYYKAGRIKEPFSFIQFSNHRKFNHLGKTDKCVARDMYIDADRFYTDEYPLLLCSNWEGSHLSVNVWNKLYDRSLIDCTRPLNAGIRMFWGEDQVMNIFMLQKITGAYYLPDPLYVYREFTGGTSKFSMTTMEDLNTIKTYQLAFLDQKGYSDTGKILKYLYAEIAAWSALYIRETAEYLDEQQLELHINNMLNLPTFIKAGEYYSNHPEAWDEAEMIRRRHVQDYLEYARREEKKGLRARLIKNMKQIYKSI